MPSFVRRSRIPADAEAVFRWHARHGALERLTPPWERVEVVSRNASLADGARAIFRVGPRPLSVTWVAEHRDLVPGRQFRDVQVRGPFARWDHLHRLEPDGSDACFLEDRIDYALPAGALGALVAGRVVESRLARLFNYRHRVTADDVALHRSCAERDVGTVLVTGASGLLGTALRPFLTTGGHTVVELGRRGGTRPGSFTWDPSTGQVDPRAFEGVDAVIHLAGENIAGGRWTASRKRRIRESRVQGTRLLAESLASLPRPPRTLLCASATGFYGDRGDEPLTEASPGGEGFLADVSGDWEEAARPAGEKGIRVVFLRFGVVLTPGGGALGKMLLPFRLGAGGRLGRGDQWFSWVALDDALGAMHHALLDPTLTGPVNVVAPEPVTNRTFARTLAHVLGRPALAPVPAAAARLLLGEMADALLLASTRVEPARLREAGYAFLQPSLEGALRHLLGRIDPTSSLEDRGTSARRST